MTGHPTTPNVTEAAPSPNDVLASEITEALVCAGLVTNAHRGQLLNKLKAGGVSQDDWNLWIDMATSPQGTTGEDDDE